MTNHRDCDIAPTFEEQFAKIFTPRPARTLSPEAVRRIVATIKAHPQELRSVLLDVLAEDIGQMVVHVVKHLNRY